MSQTSPGRDHREIAPAITQSVAARDIHGVLAAVMPGNGDVLRSAALHIRASVRRKAMRPIPGNIVFIGVMDIARRWLRTISQGFVSGRAVVVKAISRPEDSTIASTMMPGRLRDRPMGNRMRRMRGSMRPGCRSRECLAGAKQQRQCADRCDKRAIRSMRHGRYHRLVTEQPPIQARAGVQRPQMHN
jgi:hypothetical protein